HDEISSIALSNSNQAAKEFNLPSPLPDGYDVLRDSMEYAGRKSIIVNEWGPYNFKYPLIWLRDIVDGRCIFAIFGPEGNWKIKSAMGLENGSMKTGTLPTTLTATRANSENENIKIELEFIGSRFVDQFGQVNERGNPYYFSYSELNF
ncbi:MAG: hypothetical protein HKN76_19170, partial [Saprospiraceae bacterium]|nr:hypothetical protein [Saprospiraceae bacterium]